MQARATVCKRVQYSPQPRWRRVGNPEFGTIVIQKSVKIDQNAQKSDILGNKKRPRKEAFRVIC